MSGGEQIKSGGQFVYPSNEIIPKRTTSEIRLPPSRAYNDTVAARAMCPVTIMLRHYVQAVLKSKFKLDRNLVLFWL